MAAVGGQVDEQAAGEQVVAGPDVGDLVELVLEPDGLAAELGQCQRDVGLCRLAGQVRDRQPELPVLADPQPRDDPLVRGVPLPGRQRLETDRVTGPERLVIGRPQELAIEVVEGVVGLLVGLATELDGDLGAGTLDLAVPNEQHPGQGRLDERRRPFVLGCHLGRDPWPVAFLEQADRAPLVRVVGAEVSRHRTRIAGEEPLEQRHVVGVVEAELLEPVFHAPVRLADQHEFGIGVVDGARGVPPELAERRGILGDGRRDRATAPRRPEDVVEHQHRHRADDAVAPRGDLAQRLGHRPRDRRVAVVELGRVGPRREVRVAAVGDPVTTVRADLEVALRVGGPLVGIRMDEPIRVATDPRMVHCDVVRDEVEDQPDAGRPESLAEGRQAVRAAEVVGGLIGRDRVRRADDVLVGTIGEDLLPLAAQGLGATPQTAAPRADHPDAGQPDEVEAEFGDRIDVGLPDVAQRRPPSGAGRQPGGPGPGIDLEEPRVAGRGDPQRCPHSSRPPRHRANRAPAARGSASFRILDRGNET